MRTEAAQAAARQFHIEHCFVPEIAADDAELGRNIGAQEAHRPGFAPNLLARVLLFAPLRLVRHHLGLEEPRHSIAKDRQVLVHPWRYVALHFRWRASPARARRAHRALGMSRERPPAAAVSHLGGLCAQPLFASSRDDNSAWPTASPEDDLRFDLTPLAPKRVPINDAARRRR